MNKVLKQFAIDDLKRMQAMSLEDKIERTKLLIKEYYEYFNGNVYVSFSGGKDSTVLLDIVRSLYPQIPAVYCNTGLEYPEINSFVNTVDNVTIIKPKRNFRQIILEKGYPVVSKDVAKKVYEARNTKSPALLKLRMEGIKPDGRHSRQSALPKKWHYLLDAPFKIHSICCDIMKKYPFEKYERETGKHAILGLLAEESSLRLISWVKYGCNAFEASHIQSRPLMFWTEQDILEYIYKRSLPIASVYGTIVKGGGYSLTGVERTGCMFCMFGTHLEPHPNKFERMKETHPKQYAWCLKDSSCGGLGLQNVLDYVGISY